jgi:hypothetical protein
VTDYERGFRIGEGRAWIDRQEGVQRKPPPVALIFNERLRGYWDGYMPRNPAWAVIHRTETV